MKIKCESCGNITDLEKVSNRKWAEKQKKFYEYIKSGKLSGGFMCSNKIKNGGYKGKIDRLHGICTGNGIVIE